MTLVITIVIIGTYYNIAKVFALEVLWSYCSQCDMHLIVLYITYYSLYYVSDLVSLFMRR